MMRVSIIMPSLNQAPYIEQAIRSVLEQDWPSLELIIVDGMSGDGTADIVRRLASERPGRIRWLSEPDDGPADAINKGLSIAEGELIGWLNSDDLYHSDAIRQAADAFKRRADWMMVYGNAIHIDESGNAIGPYPTRTPSAGLAGFATGCYICQPAVFLRRKFIELHGVLDPHLRTAFDMDWWMRAFQRDSNAIGHIEAVLASSRLHQGCITRRLRETAVLESMRLLHLHLGSCPERWARNFIAEILMNAPQASRSPTEATAHAEHFLEKACDYMSHRDCRSTRRYLGKAAAKLLADREMTARIQSAENRRLSRLSHWARRVWMAPTIREIKSTRLFDESWYLSQYGQQIPKNMDPALHYLVEGARLGLDPSPDFSSSRYLAAYPDVALANVNPLIHYLRHGQHEARIAYSPKDPAG